MNKVELNIKHVIWLAIGVALASLPHWQRLPVWIPVLHMLLLLSRIIIPVRLPLFWKHKQNIVNIIRLSVMFGGVFSIYSSYGTIVGREVGIALLVMLSALKIFESKSKRDYYICAYLGYFLIITNFFYSQTIPTALYMFFVIIIMTAGLINYNDTEQQLTWLERFKLSSTLLIQSLPILLVLFILFPRINGPLWGLPKDAYSGTTGINDQMSPGTISKLARSSEVAFRVTFEDEIPNQTDLYWRGPVLWHTDGRKWTIGKPKSARSTEQINFTGEPLRYEVTIEPSNKRWLFGLEMISVPPKDTYLTYDYQLKSRKPINARKAFNLTAYNSYQLTTDSVSDLERGLHLPEANHPKTHALATKLRDEYKDPTSIVNAAIEWIKQGGFIYTLEPPLMTVDPVDEFLFDKRQGFCEHYASAFVVLMRAAGIPARVVTGYQGGETNPIGNYLTVRQYDAHAWAEVWLENKGWSRIDPTAAVSPIRVNEGIENAIPETIINIPLGLENNITAKRLWDRIRNTVDMVNYQWAQWVLGYGPDRQKRFLERLGFNQIDWKGMTLMLLLLLGIIVAGIITYLFKTRPRSSDPAKLYYDKFCTKLARVGLPRASHEGPLDYAQRLSSERKDLMQDIKTITDLYIHIRYRTNYNELLQLKTAIRSFTPRKSGSS